MYRQTRDFLIEAAALEESDDEARSTIEEKIKSFTRRIDELASVEMKMEEEDDDDSDDDEEVHEGDNEREEIDEEALSDSRDSSSYSNSNNNSNLHLNILEPPRWSNELVGEEDLIEKHNLETQIKEAKKRAETFTKSLEDARVRSSKEGA